MKKSVSIILTALAIVLATSCSKSETYPDGGDLDMAEKNIRKSWKLTSYLRNGVNETNLVLITSYTESYDSQGVYTRSYIKEDQTQVAEDGVYSFTADLYELRISDVSSISGFSAANSTLSSSAYKILKLTETEFRYSFINGSDEHEFRFIVTPSMK